MLAVLRLSGRLLAAHWPALIAWYLVGVLGNYGAIQLAGFVGAYTALGGYALLPLAILARLVSFVAMFLVLRDGMVRLGILAPVPADRAVRRTAFRDAVLGGILPFFAFYYAWGYVTEDFTAFGARVLEVRGDIGFAALAEAIASGTEVEIGSGGDVLALTVEPVTIAVVVLAFAARWALKRWAARLPRWTSIASVYLEALWVFLTLFLISDVLGTVTGWVQERQAMVWLEDVRSWLGAFLVPVAWAWDGVGWLVGEAGGILLLPLAWLAIAGVVYGQAVAPQAPRLSGALLDRVRTRYGTVPERVRRRLADLGGEVTARFRPIGRSIVLMWRGGPVLIGGFVLLYTVLALIERLLRLGLTRMIGPQEIVGFWLVADTFVFLLVVMLTEPVRIVLVAAAYDATIGVLIGGAAAPAGSVEAGESAEREADEAGEPGARGDVDDERTDRVVGDEVGDDDRVGPERL